MGILSVKSVEAAKLPEGKREHTIYDGDNLALRLRPTNSGVSKAWQFHYRFAGKREKLHVGSYPDIGLARARELSDDYRKLLAEGADPKKHMARQKAEQLAEHLAVARGEVPVTVSQLFERWKADYLSHKHEDGGSYVEGTFRRHVFPAAGDLHLDTLRPKHIKALLDKAHNAHGLTRTCGVMLSNLRQMFFWAGTFDWIIGDPTAGLKSETWDGYGEECDRALSEAEIIELYCKIPKSTLSKRWELATWLVMSTLTRAEETLLAERKHVDLENNLWMIPKENQKKTHRKTPPRDHYIFLSPFAKRQMEGLLALPNTEQFIFPGLSKDGKVVASCDKKTHYHALRNRMVGGEPIRGRAKDTSSLQLSGGEWSVHDLRRTGATFMGELEIEPNVIDRCLNHSIPGKVQRTYNRSKLPVPMAEAWLKLGAKLESLIEMAEKKRKQEATADAVAAAIAATEGEI